MKKWKAHFGECDKLWLQSNNNANNLKPRVTWSPTMLNIEENKHNINPKLGLEMYLMIFMWNPCIEASTLPMMFCITLGGVSALLE